MKNGFRICPRINDLAVTLVWTSPRGRRLAEFLLRDPISFSFLSGFSFHLFELGHQSAFVIDLMHVGRSEILKPLMWPAVVIVLDVAANLFFGRDLIGIIPHQINFFLLDRP